MSKPFERWLTEEVEMTFGIAEVKQPKILVDWLASDEIIHETELIVLEKLRQKLLKRGDFWNVAELRLFFLGDFLEQIDFNHHKTYSLFLQRKVKTEAFDIQQNRVILSGFIDWFVASGYQKPSNYFFCLTV